MTIVGLFPFCPAYERSELCGVSHSTKISKLFVDDFLFIFNNCTWYLFFSFEHKKETKAEMSFGNKLGNVTAGVTKTQEETITATVATANKLISTPATETIKEKVADVVKPQA